MVRWQDRYCRPTRKLAQPQYLPPYLPIGSTGVLLCEAKKAHPLPRLTPGNQMTEQASQENTIQQLKERKRPLKVYVSPNDRKMIEKLAKEARLSVSDYLRLLGLGHAPKNTFDQAAILQLVKLHADQGRLGGLLKLWLTSKSNEGASNTEVRQLLYQVEACQKAIQSLVKKL